MFEHATPRQRGAAFLQQVKSWSDARMMERSSRYLNEAGHRLLDLGDQVAHRAQVLGDQVAHQALDLGDQVAHQARDLGDQVSRRTRDMSLPASIPLSQIGSQLSHLGGPQLSHLGRSLSRLRRADLQPESPWRSPLLWLSVGMVCGALLGMLAMPAGGRRRRRMLRDRLSRATHKAADAGAAARGYARDIQHRTTGMRLKWMRFVHRNEPADDSVVLARVQTRLGRLPLEMETGHMNLDCCDGVITVRAPQLSMEQADALEEVIREVAGVQDVRMALTLPA